MDDLSLTEHKHSSPPSAQKMLCMKTRLFLEAVYVSTALPDDSTLKNDIHILILISKTRISQLLLPGATERRKGQSAENCK